MDELKGCEDVSLESEVQLGVSRQERLLVGLSGRTRRRASRVVTQGRDPRVCGSGSHLRIHHVLYKYRRKFMEWS